MMPRFSEGILNIIDWWLRKQLKCFQLKVLFVRFLGGRALHFLLSVDCPSMLNKIYKIKDSSSTENFYDLLICGITILEVFMFEGCVIGLINGLYLCLVTFYSDSPNFFLLILLDSNDFFYDFR